MAGTLSDFQVYQDQFFGGVSESVQQFTDVFGAASRNALRMIPQRHRGEYQQESFFTEIASLIARRDPSATTTVADLVLAQDEFVGVKLNRRIGPVANTLDSFRKIGEDPETFSFRLGQQWGAAIAEDHVDTMALALRAALDNTAAVKFDATDGTLESKDLVDGLALFGDRASRIVAWVMHSKVFFDLVKDQIADQPLRVGDLVIQSGLPVTLNRPVIVTDSADLIVTGTPDQYFTLGLVEDAAVIKESEEREIVTDMVTGEENLTMRVQGEYAYTLSLKGFKWDITNGGANPDDTALGTGTNWDQAATDDKNLAGVVIESD